MDLSGALKKGQSEIAFGGQRVEGVVRLLRFNSGIWKQAAATAFNGSCKKLFLYRTVRYVFKWKFQRYSGDEKSWEGDGKPDADRPYALKR